MNGFDHARFWGWCEEQARRDVRVVVSESTAPTMEGWFRAWHVERPVMTRNPNHDLARADLTIHDALYVPEWCSDWLNETSELEEAPPELFVDDGP